MARFQPRQGYRLPAPPAELAARARQALVSGGEGPLRVLFKNPSRDLEGQQPVARLRSREITLFSVPGAVPPALGDRAVDLALALFATVREPPPTGWDGVAQSLLVRLDIRPPVSVSLFERRVHFQRRGYSREKFSTAFKPRITKREERRLATRSLA